MNITIRDAKTSDKSIIARLIQELAVIEGDPSAVHDDYIGQFLSNPNVGVLLAESDSNVIGLLSYAIRPNLYHAGIACLIDELIISKKMRGQKVGSALINELFRLLQAMKRIEVSVAVIPDNNKAKDFYRKHGFNSEISLLEKHIMY